MKGFHIKSGRVTAATASLVVVLAGGVLGACSSPPPAQPAASAGSQMPALSEGQQIFNRWCRDCHSTPAGPGSAALQRKYQGQVPALLQERTDLNPEYVRMVVRQGISFMPTFRKTEITDAQLAVLAAYLAHSEGAPSAGASSAGAPSGDAATPSKSGEE